MTRTDRVSASKGLLSRAPAVGPGGGLSENYPEKHYDATKH